MTDKEQAKIAGVGLWWTIAGTLASGIAAAENITENYDPAFASTGLGALAVISYGVALYHLEQLPPTGNNSREEL